MLRLRLHQHLAMQGVAEVTPLQVRIHRPRGRIAERSRRARRRKLFLARFIARDKGRDAVGLAKVVPRVQERKAQGPQAADGADASAVVA